MNDDKIMFFTSEKILKHEPIKFINCDSTFNVCDK